MFEDRNLVVFVKLSLDEDIASMIYLGLEFQYGSAIWHYQQCILELFTVHQKKKNHKQIDENSFSNINFTRSMSLIGLYLIDTKFISK